VEFKQRQISVECTVAYKSDVSRLNGMAIFISPEMV